VTGHKFALGQPVRLIGNAVNRLGNRDGYIVTRLLPIEGPEFEYRIKSASEAHERVARESQLDASAERVAGSATHP
jgi:hypothetical protein